MVLVKFCDSLNTYFLPLPTVVSAVDESEMAVVCLSAVVDGDGVGAGVGSLVVTSLRLVILMSSRAMSPRKSSTVFVAMNVTCAVPGGRTNVACSQSDPSTDSGNDNIMVHTAMGIPSFIPKEVSIETSTYGDSL